MMPRVRGRRRLAFTITLLLGGLFNPVAAVAQPATEVARIGYLLPNPAAANPHLREAFLQGMRDLGDVEGRNFVINYRYAEGKFERLPALAAELVALKVDVIVAGPTPAALKLTRFRGDPSVCVLGVHDAQEAPTLCAGVPAADGRAGAGRPVAVGAGE